MLEISHVGIICCIQIEEYMDQLDNNKIPRVGLPGEKYRDIQLVVQLPKQVSTCHMHVIDLQFSIHICNVLQLL